MSVNSRDRNWTEGKLKERLERLEKKTEKYLREMEEYRANENHAAGVLKDRLVGILAADDRFVRKHLYGELAEEIKRRAVPIRPNREVRRKEYLKKPSQSQIKLLIGG
jgi:hypothetical protein